MIYEQRRYDVSPAHREGHINYLEERMLPTVVKHGGKYLGLWETIIGERNHVYVLLGWDNLNQRTERMERAVKDPEFWPAACSTDKTCLL